MKNKLIVDRLQARKIRDNDVCEISVNMRIKVGFSNQELAANKFINKVFWVADPICSIEKRGGDYTDHFSCDEPPIGFNRVTFDTSGSRVRFGQHRHLVKCTDVHAIKYYAGDMFSVRLTLEKVKGGEA